MIRHVVWDWNGTLFDDRQATLDALNEVLAGYGLRGVDEMFYRTRFRRPIRVFYEEIFGRPIAPDEWNEMDGRFHDRYRARLGSVGLASDAADALALAADRGLGQSVLSMWLHDDLVELVASLGIESYFERVAGARPGDGGPKRDHLVTHLDVLGAEPSSVLLVGDTVDDAAAAHAVGARCVLYEGGLHTPELLASAGRTVGRLRDALSIVI